MALDDLAEVLCVLGELGVADHPQERAFAAGDLLAEGVDVGDQRIELVEGLADGGESLLDVRDRNAGGPMAADAGDVGGQRDDLWAEGIDRGAKLGHRRASFTERGTQVREAALAAERDVARVACSGNELTGGGDKRVAAASIEGVEL